MIYKKLGYTCANAGANDLAAGLGFIKSIDTITWISSSFFSPKGSHIFKSHIIANTGMYRVGITGITSRPNNLDDDVIFKDWQSSLPIILDELENNSDFIILLSTLSIAENQRIIEDFPKIRIIVSSSSSHANMLPKLINNSLITQTGSRGKYLGHLTISNAEFQFNNRNKKNELKILQGKLHSIMYRIEQQKAGAQKSENTLLMQLNMRRKDIINKIHSLEEELKEDKDLEFAKYSSQFIALSDGLPEDIEINKLVHELKNNM